MEIDVAIVGGGIAGLATAYELHRHGISFLVLERAPRAGGVVLSEEIDGFVIDAGPDALLTQKPEDSKVREALIYALRYDKNVGVRLKSLEALKPYVKDDVRVRDAMLEALMGDSNPGVRTQALGVIKQVKQDASVRAVLMQLAEKDPNNFIKNESKRILAQAPEMD